MSFVCKVICIEPDVFVLLLITPSYIEGKKWHFNL